MMLTRSLPKGFQKQELFVHLSKHVFRSQYRNFRNIWAMRLICFSKCSKFIADSRNAIKNQKNVLILYKLQKKLTNTISYLKKKIQEARRKPEDLITWHLRHFSFSRNFFSSEDESNIPATYEMKLFVALANCWKPLAHVTWRPIQDITEVLHTPLN